MSGSHDSPEAAPAARTAAASTPAPTGPQPAEAGASEQQIIQPIRKPPENRVRNRRVAVIAVHGVGKHTPGSSAHAMADLLYTSRGPQPMVTTTPFVEEAIHVPLRPVHANKLNHNVQWLPLWLAKMPWLAKFTAGILSSLAEGSTKLGAKLGQQRQERLDQIFVNVGVQGFRGLRRATPQKQEVAQQEMARQDTPVGDDAATEFMRVQLSDYEGGAAGNDYASLKMRGQMAMEGATHDVDIYEVFWADLARPLNSVLSFLQAIYQLILHLGELSRLPLDMGAEDNGAGLWSVLRWAQRWAIRTLTVPLPILNILLLVALLGAVPRWLTTETAARGVALGMAAVIGLAVTWRVSARRRVAKNPAEWALAPALVAVASAAGAWGVMAWIRWMLYRGMVDCSGLYAAHFVLALEGWVAGLVILYVLVRSYRDVRKGAAGWSYFFYGTFLAIFVTCLCWNSRPSVEQATVWTIQGLLVGLRICWLAIVALGGIAGITGMLAWREARKVSEEVGARSHAAVRTSRLALALPTLLFFMLSVSLWSSGYSWLAKRSVNNVGLFDGTSALTARHIPAWLELSSAAAERATAESANGAEQAEIWKEWRTGKPHHPATNRSPAITTMAYFHQVLIWEAGTGLSVMVWLALMATFLLLWWASRSVLKELSPPDPRKATNAESRQMGAWTTRGLDAMGIVTAIFWIAVFVVPVFFGLIEIEGWRVAKYLSDSGDGGLLNAFNDLRGQQMGSTQKVLSALAGTVALLGLLLHRISPGLGAILDVDNYLRTGPKEATPKAKIMERYVSTLRYVAAEGEAEGRGYDSVVIVAHSLGSMISGDLLRFLKIERDPALAAFGYGPNGQDVKIPIHLFTMGNPLRQLMNRFFPQLYRWVSSAPDNGLAPTGDLLQQAPHEISAELTPKAEDLGVESWTNAYRSGDYVGRSLWTGEWYARNGQEGKNGEWPQPITEISDSTHLRQEMCIGAGAHTHYWDGSAPDITKTLEQLIQR